MLLRPSQEQRQNSMYGESLAFVASSRRAQLSRAPVGATDLADTDSAVFCHGWTGQIFISAKWPLSSSQNTYNMEQGREDKQHEERPWYSSPSGQPE